jgi:tetratricopeptide (TPR) repeat protein
VLFRWDQGRLDELVPLLAGALEANPGLPIFRAWLALAHCDLDNLEEAGRYLAGSASERFEDVPHDILWVSTLCLYAEVCTRLGAREPAAVLYDALAPYGEQLVFTATTVLGSVERHLGQLAATLGRHDAAERHFTQACAVHERIGAPGYLARTRCDWANALLERGGAGDAERAAELLEQAARVARELGAAGIEKRATGATAGAR